LQDSERQIGDASSSRSYLVQSEPSERGELDSRRQQPFGDGEQVTGTAMGYPVASPVRGTPHPYPYGMPVSDSPNVGQPPDASSWPAGAEAGSTPTDEHNKRQDQPHSADETDSSDEDRHVTVEATFIPIGDEWQHRQHVEQQAQQQRRQRSLAASSSGRRTMMQLPPGVVPGPPG
jgi:hypothetical protein